MFVNNFFKFFIKQGYKDSNLEMTESESVALPFGDSPIWSAGGGIRTHAPLRTNGFQDRLVMTTSIPLHESGWWESNPRIQLGRLVFYHWTTPAYLIVYKSGWQDSNLRPPGPKPGALAKLSHTPICCFAVSFLLPHRSDSDIISPYSILVNTFLHFFEIIFSNTIHPAFKIISNNSMNLHCSKTITLTRTIFKSLLPLWIYTALKRRISLQYTSHGLLPLWIYTALKQLTGIRLLI